MSTKVVSTKVGYMSTKVVSTKVGYMSTKVMSTKVVNMSTKVVYSSRGMLVIWQTYLYLHKKYNRGVEVCLLGKTYIKKCFLVVEPLRSWYPPPPRPECSITFFSSILLVFKEHVVGV